MHIDTNILETIAALPERKIIGVSGYGGSGKTNFANELRALLNAPAVGVDSFQKNRTDKEYSLWNIMDYARLEREVLAPFVSGATSIRYGHFEWAQNNAQEMREVPSTNILIIEGVGLFRPELMKYFAYTIWVDCPLEEAIARGKKRDKDEHHNPQDELWDGIWKKNDIEYFDAYKANEIADVIISSA
ncbi:MAG: uridine kinase family protein [Minisyncoccota bacterium]